MRLLLTLFCFAAITASSAQDTPNVHDHILQMIQIIKNDPLSKASLSAYQEVLHYGITGKDVVVVVGEATKPLSKYRGPYSLQLLGSFTAGNIEGQLRNYHAADDTYNGLLLMFKTYNLIRESNSRFHLAGVDRQIELYQQNKLRDYVDEKVEEALQKAHQSR